MPTTRITGPLNTTQLVETVAADLDIDHDEAEDAVHAVFDIITRAAASGHDVVITNFGAFISYRTKSRRTRNPVTGEKITVPAHQKVKFKVAPRLAEAVRARKRRASIAKLPKGALTNGRAGAGAAGRP